MSDLQCSGQTRKRELTWNKVNSLIGSAYAISLSNIAFHWYRQGRSKSYKIASKMEGAPEEVEMAE